ncbi:hypothetical protein FF124_06705 [Martelella lutilitoris]|uniref:DUF1453 domain-containing protein n=1 Tax=Martelella lutilitoris TaxID=2583532 RepID=A0A5C4JTV2_9HYPH|nr:DUF6622 family protein [Martelella lutilitoris]MAM10625.1 hypothetical protein [Rhizobiaceae bacterium]TNB48808.1 hypothetical protein FF124_06705 [Martelella lutilitoris]|tara:strand:- start:367 stop:870 length:504 start_codon:yes stop_codon:yes gene_type:complete
MEMLVSIIAGTPIYVWVILVILVLRGAKRFQDKEVSVNRLFILPLLFLILAAHRVVSLGFAAPALQGLGLGLLLGGLAVWLLRPQRKLHPVSADRVLIEGEWHTLAMVLMLFAALYVQNAGLAINPDLAKHPAFMIPVNLFVGLATGFSVARSAVYMAKARRVTAEA